MKKKLLIGLLSLGMGFAVQAAQITGSITFGGSVSLNTASAGTATQVTAWHGFGGVGDPVVIDASGNFTGFVTPGVTTATFAIPWNFNSGAIAAFWTAGGFTFNLTSSFIVSQGGTPAGVVVNGSGFVSGNGFAATFGTWAFSTQDPSAGSPPRFSFSAASGSVPDGGSTVALLGLALMAVEGLRRTFRTAKLAA